jgi:hypothetical protein
MSSVNSGAVGSGGVSQTELSVWGNVAAESIVYKRVDAVEMDERVVKQVGEFVNTRLSHHVKFLQYDDLIFGGFMCRAVMRGVGLEGRSLEDRAIWWKSYIKLVHEKISIKRGNLSKSILREYSSTYLCCGWVARHLFLVLTTIVLHITVL